MIPFVVAMSSSDGDFSEDDASLNRLSLYTGKEENNLSMWIGWIFLKKTKKQKLKTKNIRQSKKY